MPPITAVAAAPRNGIPITRRETPLISANIEMRCGPHDELGPECSLPDAPQLPLANPPTPPPAPAYAEPPACPVAPAPADALAPGVPAADAVAPAPAPAAPAPDGGAP